MKISKAALRIGYIGLGRMGKNMVLHLLEQGVEVVAWNRSPGPLEEVVKAGAIKSESLEDLVKKLDSGGGNTTSPDDSNIRDSRLSRDQNDKGNAIIWLMLTAGGVTDEFVNELAEILSPGDIVIDGGNSFYKDTLKRNEILRKKGIHFMDIGTSGGPKGARTGACLMVGGSKEDFEKVKELVKAAAAQNAYQHLGSVGAGHFAKMVHNAIENGMMESIGEGLAVLENSPFKYDFVQLLDLYNHRSVVESRLIGWIQDAFKENADLSDTSSVIGSGGAGKERVKAEGDWTLDFAKEINVDAPAIESAMLVRSKSAEVAEDSPNGFRNKVISAMRGQFGQHDVKK